MARLWIEFRKRLFVQFVELGITDSFPVPDSHLVTNKPSRSPAWIGTDPESLNVNLQVLPHLALLLDTKRVEGPGVVRNDLNLDSDLGQAGLDHLSASHIVCFVDHVESQLKVFHPRLVEECLRRLRIVFH